MKLTKYKLMALVSIYLKYINIKILYFLWFINIYFNN